MTSNLQAHPRARRGIAALLLCGALFAIGGCATTAPNGGYGNLVVIDHGLVQGRRLQTKYAHLSAFDVRVGDAVRPGTQIGRAGTTGLSTGCHLHFEVKVDGAYADPAPFLTGAPTVKPSLVRLSTTTPTVRSSTVSRIHLVLRVFSAGALRCRRRSTTGRTSPRWSATPMMEAWV